MGNEEGGSLISPGGVAPSWTVGVSSSDAPCGSGAPPHPPYPFTPPSFALFYFSVFLIRFISFLIFSIGVSSFLTAHQHIIGHSVP